MKIINILLSSLLIRGTESFMIPAPDSASKLLIPPLQMTWTHLSDIDSFSREMQQKEQQLQQQEQINSYSTTKS